MLNVSSRHTVTISVSLLHVLLVSLSPPLPLLCHYYYYYHYYYHYYEVMSLNVW